MKYMHIESGRYPLQEHDLIIENKNLSPTYPFTVFEGYVEVVETPPPSITDPKLQKAVLSTPELVDRVYTEVWEVVDLQDDEKAQMLVVSKEAHKRERERSVSEIVVQTAAGNIFQGDEISQTRMTRVITVLSTGFANTVPWILANNTVIQADIAELTEALALAGAEQARLWVQ